MFYGTVVQYDECTVLIVIVYVRMF